MRPVRSERGSLPMVMLAILVVGSLTTVLVGTVVIGQGQTRFDQSFEQSLPIAETGLERMVYLVRSGQRPDDFSLAETQVAGGRYSGSAVRSGRKWALTATGTAADGTSRTLSLTIDMESVFGVAAFGRTQVDLRGSNSADSYRSGTFSESGAFSVLASGSNICGDRMCTPTGKGVIATNGELFLRGGVIDVVDRAEIHYAREGIADPLPDATGFCSGVSATCSSAKLAYFHEPIESEPDPVLLPADLSNRGPFPPVSRVCPPGAPITATACLPAGRLVYTNVTLDGNTFVEGTPENPSIVYVTGTLTIPNGETVNFYPGNVVPKPSPGLLIFSAGIGPALRFGNHASFSGAIYAPRATFSGGAQGNLYGSMVTGSISTQGGWNFHYDEALGNVDTEARFVVSGWAEQR